MAKPASEIILEVLSSAGKPVTLASLGKQCALKGVKYATTSKAAQELTKRKQIVVVKRGVYALPGTTAAAPAATPMPGFLSAGLGVPCAVGKANEAPPKTREALLDVFDAEIAYCVNDLLELLPGWDRATVAQRLREAIAEGEITTRYDDETKANVYALASEPSLAATTPMSIAEARALLDTIDPVPDAVPARAVEVDPMNMRQRLAAICTDIEDALGDACDARLDHSLIKSLVVANGAIARTARLLGA